MSYIGSVGLVTGASSGMGKIIALRMAKQGMKVAALDTNQKGLEEISRKYNNIYSVVCDVSSYEEVSKSIKEIEENIGEIESIVHAAAIMPAKPILSTSPNKTMNLMDINYGGTVNLVHSVVRKMIEKDSGQAIFFGSIAGQVLNTGLGPYSATKSAVNTYIEILQHEIKDSGVHIMLVQPNAVDTPLINQALGEEGPKNIRESKETGRLSDPLQIVKSIEKGLRKKKLILYPNLEAKILTLARRFFPKTLWSIIEKSNE
tara:strand:+ start:126 stop:905 length:780 start_codon:yes stop_codon:yes gene_type:complete